MHRLGTAIWFLVLLGAGGMAEAQAAPGPVTTPQSCAWPREYRIGKEDVPYELMEVSSTMVPLMTGVLVDVGMTSAEAYEFASRNYFALLSASTARQMAIARAAHARQVQERLPDAYKAEFRRLSLQWQGPQALWRKDVADELKLTASQRGQIERTSIDYAERFAPRNRCCAFSYDMSAEARVSYRRCQAGLELARDRDLMALLNAPQRRAWEELIGPPSRALANARLFLMVREGDTGRPAAKPSPVPTFTEPRKRDSPHKALSLKIVKFLLNQSLKRISEFEISRVKLNASGGGTESGGKPKNKVFRPLALKTTPIAPMISTRWY